MSLEINNKTKNSLPYSKLFLFKIQQEILNNKYSLSLNIVGDQYAKKLNQNFRNKNYIPNVLSFPLEKDLGEIYMNLNKIKKEFPKYNMSYKKFFIYLFIHSLLHLKGHDHGTKMEKLEEKYLNIFHK